MNNEIARLALNPDWQFFMKHLREERDRRVNAILHTKDHDETNLLRGQIKELDTLLRLHEQAKRFKEGK